LELCKATKIKGRMADSNAARASLQCQKKAQHNSKKEKERLS